MAGQTFFGPTTKPGRYHVGRRWGGREDDIICDCPKAPCGLTYEFGWDKDCEYHGITKTIRQSHAEDDCPGEGG